jgi:class 3 adenylate cyclase/tetratricopeptide (TPR) repeat protein
VTADPNSWLSFIPHHVAHDIVRQPRSDPGEREQRFAAVALFADVSGFTAINEALGQTGKAGSEELTTILNDYFGTMIELIHNFGGIIGKFGGDALTVLFPYQRSGQTATLRRALQCALDMQAEMHRYESIATSAGSFRLAMKIGLAKGPVLSATVGDPTIRLEYIIAGQVLDLAAEAEHQASPGEVIVHKALLARAGATALMAAGQDFRKLVALNRRPKTAPLTPLGEIPAEVMPVIGRFLHPVIAKRLQAGQTGFINEHRRVTILFANFSGFDYDRDPQVTPKLQQFLAAVLRLVQRYDGYLNKVDMGDKGSKCLILFGTPVAHENDEERALRCALELQALPDCPLRMGLNTGFVYCGRVGSATRQEYTVMGDAVNLAARLMQAAQTGQILVSDETQRKAAEAFAWQSGEPIVVKGKAESIQVHEVRAHQRQAINLLEPAYTFPLVGRQRELQSARAKIEQVWHGQGQIIGLTGEAGLGKSRLAAAIINLALDQGLLAFGGAGQSYGLNTSYMVWRNIWRHFFQIDPEEPLERLCRHLEQGLTELDPRLVQRLPLLGPVLNLPLPDNTLTQSLDAQGRTDLLKSFLLTCLRLRAGSAPILFVLEDCHWLDPLSQDLLEFMGRNLADWPVLLLVIYRPPDRQQHPLQKLLSFPHVTEIELTAFSENETAELIRLKLRQLFAHAETVPPELVKRITGKAQGNPFYIEELVNFIHDRKLDPASPAVLQDLDLPDSLHSLIISRIDQLPDEEQAVLKVASVIGRQFKATWLWGSYPQLGSPQKVKQHLETLSRLDLTPLDKPEPDLEYLFKHITTQEVAYDSLAFATREQLHQAVGHFIEQTNADNLGEYIDVLAHHFGRTRNAAKQRHYFRKAADAAKANYANKAAIDYYQRLLPLLPEAEQGVVLRLLAEVCQLTGQWGEADQIYQQALVLAQKIEDQKEVAYCQSGLGFLLENRGSYREALIWLEQAQAGLELIEDSEGLTRNLEHLSFVHCEQGNYKQALIYAEQQHQLATSQDNPVASSIAIENMGLVHWRQGNHPQAANYFRQALAMAATINYQRGVILGGNNIAGLCWEQGEYRQSVEYLHQAVSVALEIGDLHSIGLIVGNAGEIYRQHGDYGQSLANYGQALHIALELGDWPGISHAVSNIATVYTVQNRFREAEPLFAQVVSKRRALNTPYFLGEDLHRYADLKFRQQRYSEALPLNCEAITVATEVGNQEVHFSALLLDIQLRVALGHIEATVAIQELMDLLAAWPAEANQAALHYALWRVEPARCADQRQAARLYQQLHRRTPNIEYRQRYQELTGKTLPDPPPLPALPEVVPGNAIDLAALLAKVEALSLRSD